MAKQTTVRFAVGNPDGAHSSVFMLKAHRENIYVAVRDLAGDQKVSLHGDHWRSGFTQEFLERSGDMLNGRDRALDKWSRPPADPLTRLTKAFVIIVPASEVTVWPAGSLKAGSIQWYATPPEGWLTSFTVWFSPTDPTDEWIDEKYSDVNYPTKLVARFDLPNGETVRVLCREQEISREMAENIANYRSMVQTSFAARVVERGEASPSLLPRASLFGEFDDGTRSYVDMAVRRFD